jgi:AcrR family transcriptional regulator
VVSETPAAARPRDTPTRTTQRGQTRGDRTRQRIIDETVSCVREEGYAAASGKHIAERAGVTWGVIQYHFGNRDAILMAVVEDGLELVRDTIERLELPRGSNREQADVIVDAVWGAFSDPVALAAFEITIGSRAGRDPAFESHLGAIARQLAELGRALTGGSEAGDHRFGSLIFAAMRGLVVQQMVVDAPIDTTREREVLVDVLGAYLDLVELR